MKLLIAIILSLTLVTPTLYAQKMSIEGFGKVNPKFLQKPELKIDKQNATLKLITAESGFIFKTGGKDLAVEQGEGFIMITLPHKSSSMTIIHPEYGQLTWKAPVSEFKRKQQYQADLITESPDKEYKINKQWAVFYTNPRNAIIYIDSTTNMVNNGTAQFYLPFGKYPYKVVSPFFKDYEGVIEVSETSRLEKRVEMIPIYSFLTVNTNVQGAEIRLDGKIIGTTEARTGKIMQGKYLLTVSRPQYSPYNDTISILAAERKVINVTLNPGVSVITSQSIAIDSTTKVANGSVRVNIEPRQQTTLMLNGVPVTEFVGQAQFDVKPGKYLMQITTSGYHTYADSINVEKDAVLEINQSLRLILAQVTIKAFDENTQIWINRQNVGKGEWQGTLKEGFYAISTVRDAKQSKIFYLWIKDDKPIELNMNTPLDNYGVMNISSNVVDGQITINGIKVGLAPMVIENLPHEQSYTVRIEKKGYYKATKKVYLKANDIVDVNINLNKQESILNILK